MTQLTATIIDIAPEPTATAFEKGDLLTGPKGGLWYVLSSGRTHTRIAHINDATGRHTKRYSTAQLRDAGVWTLGWITARAA